MTDLVRAVVGAGVNDESDCVEWKGPVDLSIKADCFLVAKAILGLANRDPARAARSFDGYGYVVAGAEPGNLHGVGGDDPASYATRVNGHVGGADGPAWTPIFVSVDGVEVLVVTVEPPNPGDRIWPLRREASVTGIPARLGTIYVRKPGKSEPANDADIDMLQARLLASPEPTPELEVEVVGQPLRWFDRAAIEAEMKARADALARQLLADAQVVQDQRKHPDRSVGGSLGTGIDIDSLRRVASEASSMVSSVGFGYTPDRRSIDEFRREVSDWTVKWVEAMLDGAEQLAAACNPVILRAANPTDLYLPDVEVEVRFEFEQSRGLSVIEMPYLPDTPRPFGEGTDNSRFLPSVAHLLPSSTFDTFTPPPSRTWVRDGSVVLGQSCGDLRPRSVDEGDTDEPMFVLLSAFPAAAVLTGTWSATVKHRSGVIQGKAELAVRPEPLSLDELLDVVEAWTA